MSGEAMMVSRNHYPEETTMSYYTDADIEMAELAEASRMAANGVCPRCEDALDPADPKWNMGWVQQRKHLDCYGPHGNIAEGYHDRCLTDEW
jgi:hypothetical protein